MSNLNHFDFSPQIKSVFEKVRPGLSAHQARLDRLSADIRHTEAALKEADFNIPVRLSVRTWTEIGEDAVEDVDGGLSGSEAHFEEYLSWDNADGNGFRLWYEMHRQEGHIQCFEGMLLSRGKEGRPKLVERKPLIDCKASKRLELEPKLADFIMEVGKIVDPAIKEAAIREQNEAAARFYEVNAELEEMWRNKRREERHKSDIAAKPPSTSAEGAAGTTK